jgi:hypothetical protein
MKNIQLRKRLADALDGGRNEKVALAIKNFCIQNDVEGDMRIYFNGICWDCDSSGKWKTIEKIKGSDYSEFANNDGIFVTTEGGLYDALQGEFGWGLHTKFCDMLREFDCYFENGNSWNFTIVFDEDEK